MHNVLLKKKIDQIMSNLQTDFHKPKVWFYHYVLLRIGCGSLFSGVKRTYQILKMRETNSGLCQIARMEFSVKLVNS